MGTPIWLSDGRSLLVPASSIDANQSQLLEVSWPNGDLFPVNRAPVGYERIDASADFKNILTIQRDRLSSLWLVPLAGGPPQLIPQMGERLYGVAWRGSETLVSETDIGGRPDFYSIAIKSRQLHRLTEDGHVKQYPALSADGRYMVYASSPTRDRCLFD